MVLMLFTVYNHISLKKNVIPVDIFKSIVHIVWVLDFLTFFVGGGPNKKQRQKIQNKNQQSKNNVV